MHIETKEALLYLAQCLEDVAQHQSTFTMQYGVWYTLAIACERLQQLLVNMEDINSGMREDTNHA